MVYNLFDSNIFTHLYAHTLIFEYVYVHLNIFAYISGAFLPGKFDGLQSSCFQDIQSRAQGDVFAAICRQLWYRTVTLPNILFREAHVWQCAVECNSSLLQA